MPCHLPFLNCRCPHTIKLFNAFVHIWLNPPSPSAWTSVDPKHNTDLSHRQASMVGEASAVTNEMKLSSAAEVDSNHQPQLEVVNALLVQSSRHLQAGTAGPSADPASVIRQYISKHHVHAQNLINCSNSVHWSINITSMKCNCYSKNTTHCFWQTFPTKTLDF